MESQDFASCYVWCTEYKIEWSIAPAQGALAKQLHLLEGTILNRPSKDDTYLLQSVDNALSIVDLLCESDGLGLADIASRLSLGRSSTYRLLYTLQRHQIIRKDAGARYHLGCRLIAMGQISLSNDELVRAVHPYLERVARETGETTHLCVPQGTRHITFVDKVTGSATIHMGSAVGVTMDAHVTSAGKVFLAWSAPETIDEYLETGRLEQVTPKAITSPDEFRKELGRIREQGWAQSDEECEIGLTTYACPLNVDGVMLGAVTIAGPSERMRANRERYLSALSAAARDAIASQA